MYAVLGARADLGGTRGRSSTGCLGAVLDVCDSRARMKTSMTNDTKWVFDVPEAVVESVQAALDLVESTVHVVDAAVVHAVHRCRNQRTAFAAVWSSTPKRPEAYCSRTSGSGFLYGKFDRLEGRLDAVETAHNTP